MAKARKSKARRSAKKKTKSGAKTKSRAKTRKPKARRTGLAEGAVGMVEEAAALRARLAGRNTFED